MEIWELLDVVELLDVPLAYFQFTTYLEKSLRSELSLLESLMLLDMATELHGVEVPKVQTAARMAGVKVVSPFLDADVMRFCCSLPLKYKYRRGVRKWLLRKIIKEKGFRLSHRKRGFSVPVGEWYESLDCVRKYLLQQSDPWLNQVEVDRTWREHVSGERDHTQRLWGTLIWRVLWEKKMLRLV